MVFATHYNSVRTPGREREVFGLQVAILDLLRAFFRHGTQEKFHFLIADAAAQGEVEEIAANAGLEAKRLAFLDARYGRENFAQFDALFRADLYARDILWQREQLEGPGFAFCALAHAFSGLEGGALLEQFCLAPAGAGDAVICPSRAAASAIRAFWDHYSEYLGARFGAKFNCAVDLPVIPLGIDVENLKARAAPDKRAAQRKALGLGENDTMLLWVGRLSHAIKAHPLAMFRAAERAAELTGANVHLVMQGYFVPSGAAAQFGKLARDVCKKAQVTFVPSNDARFPDGLWAAGDIFLSLIDNAQESFGLTPIEAMGAGLPRVISDWDGYRDSVADGEDGFLVPTLTPPPGAGQDLADLVPGGREIYGGFLGKTALSAAVDAERAAQALKILIEDKGKRAAMGQKAQARAKATYDWRHVIPAYEKLWAELAARRKKEAEGRGKLKFPLVPDPFMMFAAYPAKALKDSDKIAAAADAGAIRLLFSHEINTWGADMRLNDADLEELLTKIAIEGPVAISALAAKFHDRSRLLRTLGWLLKLGIVRKL